MNKKVCLITGGNSGIGRAAALQLAEQSAVVIIGSRNRDRGEEAVEHTKLKSGSKDVYLVQVDLSSRQSIDAAAKAILTDHQTLDVLIHNAADFDISRTQPCFSEDGIETIWATNHLGPALLTQGLWKALRQSENGRIITVASKGLMVHPFLKIRLDDPEFRKGGFRADKAYYQSKLAQVMYTYWLANQLRNTSVTANCIRVTNVKIDVNRYPDLSGLSKGLYRIKSRYSISPEEMASVYTWLALSPDVGQISGNYYDEKRNSVSSSKYSRDPANIRKLIELTERYVPGLGFQQEQGL